MTLAVSGGKLQLIQRLVHPNHTAARSFARQNRRKGRQEMMPITMGKTGETYTIKKITGKDEVRQHLAELGFVMEARITVINEIAGNLILQVKESRVALDKTMANRILVG